MSVALKVPTVVPDAAFSATVAALNATALGDSIKNVTEKNRRTRVMTHHSDAVIAQAICEDACKPIRDWWSGIGA